MSTLDDGASSDVVDEDVSRASRDIASGTDHQLLHGLHRALAGENGGYLFGDGQLDTVLLRQAKRGGGGANALGHLPLQIFEDGRERMSTAQLHANAAVAGERSGAGKHQVAQTGETGQCFPVTATGHGQAGDLGDAPGDEGGGAVMSQPEAGDDPGGDGDDVLEGPPKLDASGNPILKDRSKGDDDDEQ